VFIRNPKTGKYSKFSDINVSEITEEEVMKDALGEFGN